MARHCPVLLVLREDTGELVGGLDHPLNERRGLGIV